MRRLKAIEKPKQIGVRNVGFPVRMLGHVIESGAFVALDDSVKQIGTNERGVLVAPQSELDRWVESWPNAFFRVYEEEASAADTAQ